MASQSPHNHKLPTNEDITCGIAGTYAAGLSPGDPLCLTTQLAQILCCPAPPPLAPASPALAQDTAEKAGANPAHYEDLAWAALQADIQEAYAVVGYTADMWDREEYFSTAKLD